MFELKKKIFHYIGYFLFIFFSASIFWVMLYKYINPPITTLMIKRAIEHDGSKGKFRFEHKWIKLENISPYLVWAVIAAEDNNFLSHWGVDWEAIRKAQKINKYSKTKHGASTISQQTAKNVFLFPARTYLRKVLELYFTYLMEIFWSKKRIMEVYLNVVELGRGIYGIEAAAQFYFKKPASKLTRSEATLIAAILPSPLKRNPANPSPYLIKRQQKIISIMKKIGQPKL